MHLVLENVTTRYIPVIERECARPTVRLVEVLLPSCRREKRAEDKAARRRGRRRGEIVSQAEITRFFGGPILRLGKYNGK